MKITVPEGFIKHRDECFETYNQRGRSDRVFKMNIDAEILEFWMITMGYWYKYPAWQVDAITEEGKTLDVKMIRKYWNVSREKTLNLIEQRKWIDEYHFYEWVYRPGRPLEAGDEVQVRLVGVLPYDTVADNLKKSYKEPDGFYVDVRTLLGQDWKDNR